MCKGMLMWILEFPILTGQSILRHTRTALIFVTPFCCSTSYNIQDINCIALWIYKYWLSFDIQRLVTDQIRYWSELTMERPLGGGGVLFLEKNGGNFFYIEMFYFLVFSRPFCSVWNYVTKQVIDHRKINNFKASSWLVVLDIEFRIWDFIYGISYYEAIDNIAWEFDCRFGTFFRQMRSCNT